MSKKMTIRFKVGCMKTEKLGWKEKYGIQNIVSEDSQWNILVYHGQVKKIWKNCITVYVQPNRPDNI